MSRKISEPLRVAYATVKGLHEIGLVDDATLERFRPLPDNLSVSVTDHREIQKRAISRRRQGTRGAVERTD